MGPWTTLPAAVRAEKAGVAPATKVIAVNNRQFSPTVLRETVQATATAPAAIDLLIKNGEYYSVHRVEYQGGEKYPTWFAIRQKRIIFRKSSSR